MIRAIEPEPRVPQWPAWPPPARARRAQPALGVEQELRAGRDALARGEPALDAVVVADARPERHLARLGVASAVDDEHDRARRRCGSRRVSGTARPRPSASSSSTVTNAPGSTAPFAFASSKRTLRVRVRSSIVGRGTRPSRSAGAGWPSIVSVAALPTRTCGDVGLVDVGEDPDARQIRDRVELERWIDEQPVERLLRDDDARRAARAPGTSAAARRSPRPARSIERGTSHSASRLRAASSSSGDFTGDRASDASSSSAA